MKHVTPFFVLILIGLAFVTNASAANLETVDSAGNICNEDAVLATNCYHCPEYSSSYEYCRDHPEDQVYCSYMVHGICILS